VTPPPRPSPVAWLLCILLALVTATPATAQIAPDAHWRTLDTPHFRVNYVAGLDTLARRAADRAERAYALLASELPHTPRQRIELTVADNVDFANGYATPIPTNRIVLYAHPPADEPELAFYSDWVELIVLHELVHIFHLDSSEGIWRDLRAIFGRSPALFPALYSPGWVKEGLAVYYESRLTPTGRLRGTQHEMALRTAILEDAFFSIDQASSDPVLWPGGSGSYIYGAHFLDYLSRHYGAERIPDFIARGAREWIPFFQERAASGAFGVSFTRGWREWEDSLATRFAAEADSLRRGGLTEPEILTSDGRDAYYPRYAPRGGALAYASGTGRAEPSLELILPDGSTRRIAPRTTLGPAAWSPDGRELLYSQLEYRDPYRVFSNLFRTSVDGGRVQRIKGPERVWEADLHPDGARAVGVMNSAGSNVLALIDLPTGQTRVLTPPDLDVHWSLPRWSPDGTRIAVARWSAGGFYDIVLVDTAGQVVRTLTRDRAVDVAPTWSPDGRWVLFSSDRTGISNLFACDLESGALLQVTNLLTGASQPDVSPDARWIAFSLYRADGYHIARIPFAPEEWRPAPSPSDSLLAGADTAGLSRVAGGPSRTYSAFPSVLPATWTPVFATAKGLGAGLGGGVGGVDVVGRHAWAADAAVYLDDLRFDGGAGYVYRGLGNPALAASVIQRWDVLRSRLDTTLVFPEERFALRRERSVELSALWRRQRWRSSSWVSMAAELNDLFDAWDGPPPIGSGAFIDLPPSLGASLTGGYSTVRRFPYSIGPQQGVRVTSTAEGHRSTRSILDEDEPRSYLRSVSHLRAYRSADLGGFARHVFAVRVDLGLDRGRGSPGFSVGGFDAGTPLLPVELVDLGGGITFPVRGYTEGAQFGTSALTASAEYRFPIRLVQRGIGIFPIFLDRLSGTLFADAGTACLTGDCVSRSGASDEVLTSVGAELIVDLQLGFGAPLPLRFGVAQPLNPDVSRAPRAFIGVGRAF
jgi:Tol biopolymer transport system component